MRSQLLLMATPLVAILVSGCGDSASTMVGTIHASPIRASLTAAQLADISVPSGFTSQLLARSAFTDPIDVKFRIKLAETQVVNVIDPSDVVVAKVTVQPGGSIGWHTHPGPAIAVIQSGTLSIIHADDCVLREYPAGKAFVDEGFGSVHVGFNAGTTETIVYVTYLAIPPGSPLIPTTPPDC